MFKKILKLGIAAVTLYYAYQVYDVHYGTDDMYKDGFGKKFKHQVLDKGKYDILPPPTKPAPKRLIGPYDPEAVKKLLSEDQYPGINPKIPLFVAPQLRSKMTQDQVLSWQAENKKAFIKAGIASGNDFTRLDLYEEARHWEVLKNCVEPPLKGGYGYHITCCEGWKKTVIRGVAYWGRMTMAEAEKEVKTHTDKDGVYETDIYVFERHYADCPHAKGRGQQYLYVEQNIPDSLAYASHKEPPSISKVAQNIRQ